MNIGVDIDGVIADTDTQFRKYMREIFKRDFPRFKVQSFKYEECFKFTAGEFKILCNLFLNEEVWINVLPIKDSIESLKLLSKKSKIVIATARPLEVKSITIKWLKKYEVPYDEIHFTLTKKHLLPMNLKYKFHYFIEDHPDYAVRIADLDINVLLFSYPWNKKIKRHSNIKRVFNWKQILKIVGHNGPIRNFRNNKKIFNKSRT